MLPTRNYVQQQFNPFSSGTERRLRHIPLAGSLASLPGSEETSDSQIVNHGYQSKDVEKSPLPDVHRAWSAVGEHACLIGDDRLAQELHLDLKRPKRPRSFFTIGKVFTVLWSEPAGESPAATSMHAYIGSGTSRGCYGATVFTKIRRFIVAREGPTHCIAVPIATYNGQGVSKSAIIKSEHAIVHTTKTAPEPLPGERPTRGEAPMLPQSIRVDVDNKYDKLDSTSRINFGKVYSVEYNIRVRSLGKVNRDSMQCFCYYFISVIGKSLVQTANVNTSLKAANPAALLHGNSDGWKGTNLSDKQSPSSLSKQREDVQTSAAEVASFFRSQGRSSEADMVEKTIEALSEKSAKQDNGEGDHQVLEEEGQENISE